MEQTILNFDKVCFSYKNSSALVLEEFSMNIKQGKITSVLGPNGTGKTTMLMLALGWLKADSGFIKIDGKDLKSFSRKELGTRIGLVPQFEHVSFEFNLLEFVLMGRAPYIGVLKTPQEKDYEIAFQALKSVGMDHKIRNLVQELSGGERQLVLLARALAQETEILLLDEPMSHLDLKNKVQLIDILRKLSAAGKTIIMTTHEPDVAAAISTDLVLVNNGTVFNMGSTEEVMTDENLSQVYGVNIRGKEVGGHRVFIWM
jgi:iron complex transport system ATP-binding protein